MATRDKPSASAGARRLSFSSASAPPLRASTTSPTRCPRCICPPARSSTCPNNPPTGARSTCRILSGAGQTDAWNEREAYSACSPPAFGKGEGVAFGSRKTCNNYDLRPNLQPCCRQRRSHSHFVNVLDRQNWTTSHFSLAEFLDEQALIRTRRD